MKETVKWRQEHLPASLTFEVLGRGFSLTSKVISVTVLEKGQIKHLQLIQPSAEDVTCKACVSIKHKMSMLVFTANFSQNQLPLQFLMASGAMVRDCFISL